MRGNWTATIKRYLREGRTVSGGASGYTNRGKYLILQGVFRAAGLPTNFFVGLVKSTPTAASTTLGGLTEIAAGNGYTAGGYSTAKNSTDWDTIVEAATTYIRLKDIVWTAVTGSMPSDSNGATYAVLLDDNATVGSRQVLAFWDLVSARVVSVGQSLTLQDLELDLT